MTAPTAQQLAAIVSKSLFNMNGDYYSPAVSALAALVERAEWNSSGALVNAAVTRHAYESRALAAESRAEGAERALSVCQERHLPELRSRTLTAEARAETAERERDEAQVLAANGQTALIGLAYLHGCWCNTTNGHHSASCKLARAALAPQAAPEAGQGD